MTWNRPGVLNIVQKSNHEKYWSGIHEDFEEEDGIPLFPYYVESKNQKPGNNTN